MKRYYITNGILHPEKSGLYTDMGDVFEIADDQKKIVIPESVQGIAHGCFERNTAIQTVILPKGLIAIDAWAFRGCSALEEIEIPEGVSRLRERLFNHCTALRKVTLPSTLTVIPNHIFEGCIALKEIEIPEGVRSVSSGAFQGCTALERIAIPSSVFAMDWNALKDCTALREVVIAEGMESIESSLFENCGSLEKIVLPQSIRMISYQAFKNCKKLRHLEMPGVRNLNFNIFEGCEALEEIIVNEECALGANAFEGATIPTKVQNGIVLSMDGRIAFGLAEENKEEITEIVIPEGVTHIAGAAFSVKNCRNIRQVRLPDTLKSIGVNAFTGCRMEEILLPAGVCVIGEQAFLFCSELKKAVLNEGLHRIERSVFSECRQLQEVTIPSTVTMIGSSAFENCLNLEKLSISEGITSIGKGALKGCDKLPSHILPESIRRIFLWENTYEFVPDGKVDSELSKDGALHELMRFFKPKVIAQLIIHQKGKQTVEEISKGMGQGGGKIDLSAVCKAICAEITVLKKKAFDSAVSFYTDHAEKLSADDIREFIAVLEKKKAIKNIEALQANAVIQNKLSEANDTPAAAQHPMEASLPERIAAAFRNETLATIRKAGRDLRANKQIPDGIIYADGTPVSDDMFALLVKAAQADIQKISPIAEEGCREIIELVEAFDADAFGRALHQIADEQMYRKNIALVALMCIYGDEKLIAKLTFMHLKWNEWSEWRKEGKSLYSAFPNWVLYSPTREALVFADKKKALDRYAEIHHTTESALRSKLLADFGFDEKGVRVFRAGDAEIEASLNPDASVQLYNRKTGKVIKSFPKKGEPNDGEAFAAWKKQLATVVKSRIKMLKDIFINGNMYSVDAWQEENCSNPIYAALAKGVVWGAYDKDGAYRFSFRLNESMETVDSDGEAVELEENVCVSVLHPVDCEWAEIKAWKEVFSMIAQPIEQLDIPVRLPDANTLISRYEGCMVNVGKLLHGMNGVEEEGTVTGGNDTVKVMTVHGYDYWGEYPVEEVLIDETIYANKRKYSTDILQMDNLLNPFAKAEAAIAERDIEQVRGMIKRGLIIRDNIQSMIARAADEGAVEISAYLINLSREWGMAEDEDDLSL